MDITQLNEILGLASSAVGVTGRAASTITAVKALFEGDKSPDNTEAVKQLNSLATELTMANIMNVQLSEALRGLSAQLQKEDAFEQEKARYELFETRKSNLVFKLRAGATDGQPMHFICPVCLNRDKLISFLSNDGSEYLYCQTVPQHFF